jgi:hypothetical protein
MKIIMTFRTDEVLSFKFLLVRNIQEFTLFEGVCNSLILFNSRFISFMDVAVGLSNRETREGMS